MKRFALLPLVLVTACAAQAEPSAEPIVAADTAATNTHTVHFATAQSAEKIDLTYTAGESQVEGDSITDTGGDISVSVSGLSSQAHAVRIVLVDHCSEFGRPLFDIVFQCDLKPTRSGVWRVETATQTCTELTHPDNVDTEFPDLLLERRTREGDDYKCSQEIAVVADGTWLTDPVSGGHNFGFQVQHPR